MIPLAIRMKVRRWIALTKRAGVDATWPIMPGSEKAPKNWTGWPNGKQFGLVLTHDVEGQSGIDRCRSLMKLEQTMGFRSSFNLIPEGEYTVPPELRHELTANGFEVGVHDLEHNGKLYRNRREFSEKASKINQYLEEWGAVGFRSGFMLHNLDWLNELNITYDASTFDTDPFEPQPQGRNTIFPFWVPRSCPSIGFERSRHNDSRKGYVELPYTLPQDSTLFLLFLERDLNIWFRKLDWIVQNGGMVLLDTHPDYMRFNGSPRNGYEYPVAFYEEFLDYVSNKYRGQYWLATPKEVAEWHRVNSSESRTGENGKAVTEGKRAAVVLYSYYPSDPRPRRAAEALVEAGMDVEVICLRQTESEPVREVIDGVRVRRLPMRRRRDNKVTYLLQYGTFIALSTSILAHRSLSRRYDLVHVHNMPDVLVFSGLVPKLRGAQIILDLHDPMPELMMAIFGLQESSAEVRLLKGLEKASIWFADQVLTVNLACKRIFASRSCEPSKIQVIMNSPDERIFTFAQFSGPKKQHAAKPFVIMYHGSIVERHGLDLAIEALQTVRKTVPGAELRIYGSATPFLEIVMASVRRNGLSDAVKYFGSKALDEIRKAIQECDLGIIPNRQSVFTKINTPTRIFEYLSIGKPVIAPFAPGITDYFDTPDIFFFELGNTEDLARKIEYVYFHPTEVEKVVERGQAVYWNHCWSREKQEFVNRVGELLVSLHG